MTRPILIALTMQASLNCAPAGVRPPRALSATSTDLCEMALTIFEYRLGTEVILYRMRLAGQTVSEADAACLLSAMPEEEVRLLAVGSGSKSSDLLPLESPEWSYDDCGEVTRGIQRGRTSPRHFAYQLRGTGRMVDSELLSCMLDADPAFASEALTIYVQTGGTFAFEPSEQ